MPVLFDSNAMGIGMFLGSGVAVGVLLLINEVKLGRAARGVVYAALGVLFTTVYMAFAYYAPESLTTIFTFVNMGLAFGVKVGTEKLYAKEYARREETEFMGRRGLAGLIGVLCGVCLVGGLLAWAHWQDNGWMNEYTCTSSAQGDEKICHKEGITPTQSACVREGFTTMQFFNGSKTSHNFLSMPSTGNVELAMVVAPGTQNNLAALNSFGFIQKELQRMCFPAHTLTINLWNPERETVAVAPKP